MFWYADFGTKVFCPALEVRVLFQQFLFTVPVSKKYAHSLITEEKAVF